jgi:hypothetical protein
MATHGSELIRRMKLAMAGTPSVGAIAIARTQTGVCDVGERGVCYEIYQRTWRDALDERTHGFSFLFERGRYDGFTPDETRELLTLTGEICAAVMDYRFTNVGRLEADFQAGRFLAAFPPRRRSTYGH